MNFVVKGLMAHILFVLKCIIAIYVCVCIVLEYVDNHQYKELLNELFAQERCYKLLKITMQQKMHMYMYVHVQHATKGLQ